MIHKRPPRAYDFRHIIAPKEFHNINELCDLSNVSWLHPVQSLFGNWDAPNLIMGQDFNSWDNLQGATASDLRHDPSFTTNMSLANIFQDTTAFYANYCWFLKKGRTASASISLRKEVKDANAPILRATIDNMRNLKHIFCLGSKVSIAMTESKLKPLENVESSNNGRRYLVHYLPHPGGLGLANFCRSNKIKKPAAISLLRDYINRFQVSP